MANDIPLDILIRTEKAISEIQKFTKESEKNLTKVQKSVEAISFVEIANAAIAAGKTIANALGKVIDASLESEDAVLRLEASLRLTNTATKQNVQRFSELATELQNITGISDEAILGQISYVKALGATNDQTEKVIRTATNLSAAIGGDLQSNVQILVDTFSGTIPRSLAKSIPELNRFTDAQLRSGAAVDFLNKKYPDFAKNLSSTSSVQIKILKENFNDLLEVIGSNITQSSIFKSTMSSLSDFVLRFKDELSKKSSDDKSFFEKYGGPSAIFFAAMKESKQAVKETTSEIDLFKQATSKARVTAQNPIIEKGGLGTADTKKAIDEIEQKVKSLKETLKGTGLTTPQLIQKDLSERLKIIDQAHKYKQITDKEAIDLRTKAEIDAEDKLSQYRLKKTKDFLSLNLFDEKGKLQLPTNATEGAAFGVGALTTGLRGTEGARSLLKTGATVAGTAAFGPEAGQVIGQLTEFLSQSPEQMKAAVNGMLDAIPTLIENIIQNIPIIIEAFAEKVPEIVQRLIDELPKVLDKLVQDSPRIISALIAEAPKVMIAMAAQAPFVAVQFTIEFVKNIPTIVKEFVKEIGKQISSIGGLLGGGEGGGILGKAASFVSGGVSAIGKIFKFADGGIVPSGYPNDTAPALLSSGEVVLNKDGVDNMISAFNNLSRQQTSQQSNQNIVIKLQVGEKDLADVLLNLNRNGFRTA